jgi:hypothetical protein
VTSLVPGDQLNNGQLGVFMIISARYLRFWQLIYKIYRICDFRNTIVSS